MKKLLLGGVLSFVATSVLAASDLPLIKVNCDDVKLSINTVMDNRFNFSAYWNEPANFPNTPKYIEIGDTIRSKNKKFKFSCPGYLVSYDGNIAEIKAKDYPSILDLISKYDYDLNLYSYSWYRYPNIREGFMNISYGINIKDFHIKSSIYTSNEGDDLNVGFNHDNIPKEAIIGYKVDNGELKPLLFNRKIGYYLSDFENAKTIDIYSKYPENKFRTGLTIKRIHIDKEGGIMRLYRESLFPEK